MRAAPRARRRGRGRGGGRRAGGVRRGGRRRERGGRSGRARRSSARRRRRLDGRVSLRLVAVPDRFVAGEETALVQFLNGGPARPTFTPPRPFERGVGGAPTLVQNVETLAHLALIARFGPAWFRRIGTAGGARLGSRHALGRGRAPRGLRGRARLAAARPARAGRRRARGRPGLSRRRVLRHLGRRGDAAARTAPERAPTCSLGARAIVALPARACGLAETARIARYLADESAGQCGPCVHGLDAIADALERLACRRPDRPARPIARWLAAVRGPRRVRPPRRHLAVRRERPRRLRRRGRRSTTPAAAPLQPADARRSAHEQPTRREPDRLRGARPLRRAVPRADHARRVGLPDRSTRRRSRASSSATPAARSRPARPSRCSWSRPRQRGRPETRKPAGPGRRRAV